MTPNPYSVQAKPLGHPFPPASGPLLQADTVLLVPFWRLTLHIPAYSEAGLPNPQLLLVPLLFWFASLWHPFHPALAFV